MHFGFALELSDIDLWNTDLLDIHLDLLSRDKYTDIPSILFVSIKSLRGLQDMSSRHLQDQQMCAGLSVSTKFWLLFTGIHFSLVLFQAFRFLHPAKGLRIRLRPSDIF